MSIEKRIRLLTFAVVAITLGEFVLGFIALLQSSSVAHVALVYGSQLVLFDWIIISSRNRLKRESHSSGGID
jgi:hypothetical protein